MSVGIQEEIQKLYDMGLLARLLEDKTTKKYILWGTDAYSEKGGEYRKEKEIRPSLITGRHRDLMKNRADKAREQRTERTRQYAEVFTPSWVCDKMNDAIDAAWFGVSSPVREDEAQGTRIKFSFSKEQDWKKYIDSRRLEITCGEAPYLASRYDVSTGESIALEERVGILDRKIRVVNEYAKDEEEWMKWTARAFQAVYGYEFQGDNLLIARVNLLLTFEDYLSERWKRKPTEVEYRQIIKIITWNIWQMDGLTGSVPYGEVAEEYQQLDLFEWMGKKDNEKQAVTPPKCRIYDWRNQKSLEYLQMKGRRRKMKFDFVIGNPPYQEETESESTRKPPIYHLFMENAYKIALSVELITPARFLFNAGYTPKVWNEKMLNDKHLKVLHYEPVSSKIFSNTDIKGGVVITYRDEQKDFGAIGIFTKYDALNHILTKVVSKENKFLNERIASPLNFQLSDLMKRENPDLTNRLRTSAFSNLERIFFSEKPNDGKTYISMIGLLNGKRVKRYIRRDYIRENMDTLDKYTLLLSKANGSGMFGEILSEPEIAPPSTAYTQTFIGVGAYDTRDEIENVKKYIYTKFARTMLGVLKITQDCPGPKWKYVPLQDFTSSSDIDWSQSIAGIDRQLYEKYGLDETEIEFIETHVKEMK